MKYTILFFAAALFFAGCKKEINELPEATQTGANTFGAKVDGAFWTPQKFGIAQTAPILEARYGVNNTVVINARNFASSPTESEFEIYLYNVDAPGTYWLNTTTGKYPNQSANYAYYIERRFTPTNEWITSAQYTGRVDVTRADLANRIVSGTFEFQAKNLSGTEKIINVTEGRFDVKIP